MLRAGVDLELRQLGAPELVAREHALDGLAKDFGRLPLELVAQRALPQTARVAGMTVVHLLVELLPRDRNLLGVDDDDEVARVDMRSERRLALAAQTVGDHGRETAKGLPLGVDDEPVALNLARFGAVGLHTEKGRTGVRRSGMVPVSRPKRGRPGPPDSRPPTRTRGRRGRWRARRAAP